MPSTIAQMRERSARRRIGPGASNAEASPAIELNQREPHDAAAFSERLLGKALTIRRTEETLLDLFSRGKISGTVHTCIGEEWIGLAVAEHLRPGDYIFSNHRGHGHYLAWTDDVEGLIAELMGRTTGVCGGRGGSQHLCRDGFFSNGIQGGIVPVATGLAMAQSLRGGDHVAVVFIGDGTLGEGVVYESMNIAAKWQLPLLIVVEDNGIAQSTPRDESMAGSIVGRADAFGLDWIEADTHDPEELIHAAGQAIELVRENSRPVLLHVRTSRLKSHSKGDDTRSPELLEQLAANDPINQVLAESAKENAVGGLSVRVRKLVEAADQRITRAIELAEGACPTSLDSRDALENPCGTIEWKDASFESSGRVHEMIRGALADMMARDERILLLGEDVRDPYGGAFKVSAGLSTRFGDRVRNTPISEAAIVGIGNGLALAGWRPIIEIMFGDFITLAADQIINHAAKFAWMYNGAVKVPLVIRTPMGGYRGYGPTHSQCLEKHLLGIPGTRVLALTHRYCPGELYRTLLAENDRPAIVIENKLLYTQKPDGAVPKGWRITRTDATFPTIRIRPAGECQLTVLAYGGMVSLAETAIRMLGEDEDIFCDLLVPTQLYPFDLRPVMESVRETGRLIVVEEGQGFAGIGSEIVAEVAANWGGSSPVQFSRVCADACPIPAAKTAEQQCLPDVARIFEAARQLVTR